MSKRNQSQPPDAEQKKPSRYLIVNWRRYWIRNIVVSIALFVIILWLRYPTHGASAFLWAFGIAGMVLAYFAVNYYFLRK